MLILTRRAGQAIMIGDGVAVTVLGIKGGQVQIGINAPKNVNIYRQEVYERIRNHRRLKEVEAEPSETSANVA
jgi:carbon storage regulator